MPSKSRQIIAGAALGQINTKMGGLVRSGLYNGHLNCDKTSIVDKTTYGQLA